MLSDFGLIADIGTIRFGRLFSVRVDQLWDYLTKPELLSSWLAGGEIQLRVGGYVDLSFDVIEGADRAVAGLPISGVVTRCHPPESLAFTWTDTNTISHVAFEIERQHSEVLFLLTHADLPIDRAVTCAASWHAHLDILEARLRNDRAESHGNCFRRVISHYEHHRDARMLRAKAS